MAGDVIKLHFFNLSGLALWYCWIFCSRYLFQELATGGEDNGQFFIFTLQ